ncbi:tetratricopeptide repeat protein [Marivirga sp.]|uniref:tetratricopeptide repeat protein n=1 Tax=Marivirga sp. TaxID=2018662 RepID=UPI0025F8E09A|nr:tetratricopeptide repeat protein [Marivirga sp.]
MDKQRLTTLINQPEKLEETDFKDLTSLKNEYPYFQALLPLITIGSKKYSPQSEKAYLQSSAIYALDRKHLKEILTRDNQSLPREETKEKTQQNKVITEEKNKVVGEPIQEHKKPVRKTQPSAYSKTEVTETPAPSHLPDSFFEDLFKEMEALKAEKENYQKILDRFEAKNSEKPEPKAETTKKTTAKPGNKKATATKASTTKKSTSTTKPKTSSTTKKTTSKKATTKKTSTTKSKENTKKTPTTKAKKTTKADEKKPKKDEHDIIEEINSRKELKISDAHKKEQISIINNFIEKEPVLTKRINADNQSNKQEAEDLSASSTNLSDDVVSETLAKLMIKQGRKQKAIDIYKKLIWKFPQKKTYFVEIIGELKKES